MFIFILFTATLLNTGGRMKELNQPKTGSNFFIGADVQIGKNCIFGNNVVIHDGTTIGDNVRIDDNSVIGKSKLKSPNSAMATDEVPPPAKIGNGVLIGAGVVVYAGADIGDKVLIADQAAVQFNVSVGEMTIIGRGVLIESKCSVGKKCKIESNTYITAMSVIEDYCFIAPCVATSNDNYAGRSKERFKYFKGVTVKRGGRIGVHATILPGITIGEDAMVAAGALVTKDVPAGKIYAGVPAKEFGDVPEDQLLKNNI